MIRTTAPVIAIAFATHSVPAGAQTAARPDSLALGRQYTQWLYTAKVDSLWAHSSARLKERMKAADTFREMLGQLVARAGTESEVVSERFVQRLGKPQYWRTAKFNQSADEVLLRWVIVDGEIDGMGVGPANDAPPIDKPGR